MLMHVAHVAFAGVVEEDGPMDNNDVIFDLQKSKC